MPSTIKATRIKDLSYYDLERITGVKSDLIKRESDGFSFSKDTESGVPIKILFADYLYSHVGKEGLISGVEFDRIYELLP